MEKGTEQVAANARKTLRTPLMVLKAKIDDGRKVFFGYAKNISRSGLFIATTNPREPGTSFQVEIPLPAPINHKLICTCEVIWKRDFSAKALYEPGMGLKFLDLSENQAEEIHRWVLNQKAQR
jgi:Tfp pilus assembly protein PilZ